MPVFTPTALPTRFLAALALPALVMLSACGERPASATPDSAATAVAAPAVVNATSTAKGVTLIEGSTPTNWDPGTILRIYGATDPQRMKALAVVQRCDAGRFTARLTGLSDKLRPLATGDRVVANDPEATPPAPVVDPTAALRATVATREAEAARTEQALAALHARITAPIPTATGTGLGEELARVEAERAYFELCSRILRLNSPDPAVAALQTQVRITLAARADLNLGGATPAKDAHGH